MSDEKRIFTPERPDELINGWLIHAHKCRDRHDEATRRYAKGQYALGIPSLVASTFVGTSVFSALSSNSAPPWWVGVLSIGATLLAALQTFMDFTARSDKHRSAGVKYKATIRLLEQLKARGSQSATVSQEEIDAMRASLDSLEDSAPIILPGIYDKVEKKYQDLKYVQEAIGLYGK